MSLFSNFIKTSCCHARIWSKKTSILLNVPYIIDQKSKQEAVFFDFHEKIISLIPRGQKYSFSKKQTALMLIFCHKTSILSKTLCSRVIFFLIFMIHPCCHARIWSKKCQFCQNYIKLWTKKVYRMPFFPISHKKSFLSFPYFVKKRPFSENKLLSCQY